MEKLEIKLKTLTPIWTGGVDRDCDRLHETSIIGSLRWWYEALIRGLGGKACDPTSTKCENKDHCAACELFGCTGWSRKFKLEILNVENMLVEKIEANREYIFKFIFLREGYREEKFLLFNTIKIISDIGSIGGKTVLKPSESPAKNRNTNHLDYGLIKLESEYKGSVFTKKQIEDFLSQFKKVSHKNDYPDLRNFWYVQKYYLTRTKINSVVGRDINGSYKNNTELQRWLGGSIGKSKKIYSFHNKDAKRIWGYTRKDELDIVIKLLTNNNIRNIKKVKDILDTFFKEG